MLSLHPALDIIKIYRSILPSLMVQINKVCKTYSGCSERKKGRAPQGAAIALGWTVIACAAITRHWPP